MSNLKETKKQQSTGCTLLRCY